MKTQHKINEQLQQSLTLKAVVDGDIIPIETVADAIFSERMIGDGYGIVPKSSVIYSPVDGMISEVAITKHAYYIELDSGYKILIHIGENTVLLNGEGFSTQVEKGDHIAVGEQLGNVDLEFLKEKGYDVTISVIFLFDKSLSLEVKTYPQADATAMDTIACQVTYQKAETLN
ncbi:PTS glucose transporter subunit IIA [Dolosigranulum savutiense]|uniref:PTS glucose transporter subunit IIA n=1 Tax=Dolosigranulum savutiense TaxID=3110288 RepID=A0AB74TLR9_9LACT